jgi:hypothetical protein
MAISVGNIKIISHGTGTFRVVTEDFLYKTKMKVCRRCALNPDGYDEAHYNLAEEWFRYHEYLEYTAKVFMLSKIYHRWWNQQIAQLEDEFFRKYSLSNLSPGQLREALFTDIITMNIHPSAELRRDMHNEGAALLHNNPDLWHIKIYRDGR